VPARIHIDQAGACDLPGRCRYFRSSSIGFSLDISSSRYPHPGTTTLAAASYPDSQSREEHTDAMAPSCLVLPKW
jgi:hypothetical protein